MSAFAFLRILHLRQIARQPLRTVLLVIGIAAGVTISTAGGLLVTSLDRSIRDVMRELAGPSPLRVVGPMARAGLDQRVTETVARVEGVDSVVPVVHAVTVAEGKDGAGHSIIALGVDCRVEAIVGVFGCDPQALRPTRSDAPLIISPALKRELGAGGVIRTDLGRVPITGVATNDSLDGSNAGRIVVFALPTAQRLFVREGRLDALYVQPEAGVDVERLQVRIQQEVGDWNTVLRSGELPNWALGVGPFIPLLGLAGIFGLGLSGLLVYNIVALSLAERRRDFAVAAAIGAKPYAITSGTLAEAALLGLIGGGFGALGGIALSRPLVATISGTIFERSTGIGMKPHVSAAVLVIGVVLGIVTAVAAAAVPAWRARRIDLAGELHGRGAVTESTPRRVRRRFAVLVACGAAAVALSYLAPRNGGLAAWQPPLGGLALLSAGALVFAAAGAGAPLLLGAVLSLLRRTGGPIRVAVANLVGQPRRTSVIASTVAAAVGLACVLGAAIPAVRGSAKQMMTASANGRVYVSALPINNSANVDAKVAPDVLAALARLPGVERVDRSLYVGLGDHIGEFALFADETQNPKAYPAVAGEVTSDALRRGEIIVGTSAARQRGLRPGSVMRVATPTGFAKLRVAGIWASSNNNGYSAEISVRRLEELYGSLPSTAVMLVPEPGVDTEDLASRVEEAELDPDLYALTPDELAAKLSGEIAEQVTPFWALQRVLLFVALVGALSTLLLVGVQRRRELGVLGAIGFGPSALGRMTLHEGVASALAGAVFGALGSIGVFEALRNAAVVSLGTRPPFGADPSGAAAAAVLALVVVAIGGALPAWRASRLQIVDAIRDE